jgi:hypothetical protein
LLLFLFGRFRPFVCTLFVWLVKFTYSSKKKKQFVKA